MAGLCFMHLYALVKICSFSPWGATCDTGRGSQAASFIETCKFKCRTLAVSIAQSETTFTVTLAMSRFIRSMNVLLADSALSQLFVPARVPARDRAAHQYILLVLAREV